jgi:hypothetical protein
LCNSYSFYFKLLSPALQVASWIVGVFRRYGTLREPHPRLCTFASLRRAPAGHGSFPHSSSFLHWNGDGNGGREPNLKTPSPSFSRNSTGGFV